MRLKDVERVLFEYIQLHMEQDLAHDDNHVLRVVKVAKKLAVEESACLAVVVPAAYLHDCFSYPKDHPQKHLSSTLAADKAIEFLRQIDYPTEYLDDIHHAIVAHSYSAQVIPRTLEAKIVQDADRLDAIGAIGIARCFQVATQLNRPLYSTDDPFCQVRPVNDKQFTLDHFYQKLLKLKSTMNTGAACREAQIRTEFMQGYLRQLAIEI